ncbi:MAG: HEPN domain-containing protein [Candidatus Calescibacterium sp.]
MNEEKTVKGWIFLAEGDLKTAEDELSTTEPFTNTICFHSQQCVEKYLKAYLSFVGKPFRKTHDISELIELCKEVDEEFEILYSLNAAKLTRYAVDIGYPDEFYIPSIEEAKEALEIAKKVRNFIIRKLKEIGFDYKT